MSRKITQRDQYSDMEKETSSFYGNVAHLFQSPGDYAQAKTKHEEALEIANKGGDRAQEAWNYLNLGLKFFYLGKYGEAAEYNKRALAIAEEMGDKNGQVLANLNLGKLLQTLGDYAKAEDYLQKALVITKEFDYRHDEASCCVNLGTVFHSLGKGIKAKEHFENALSISKEIGNKKIESYCYGNIGTVFYFHSEYGKSKEFLTKALLMFRELGDTLGEARICGNLGITFHAIGEYDKAKQYFERSLQFSKEFRDREGEASSYINLGEVSRSTGHYTEAKKRFENALVITKEIGCREQEATSYRNLGKLHIHFGDVARAKKCHEKALEITEEISHRQGEASCYANLGAVFQFECKYSKAKEYFEKALMIQKEIGDRNGEVSSYTNLGAVLCCLGEYAWANECHRKALAIAIEIGRRDEEAASYRCLGHLSELGGKHSEAEKYCEKALEISIEIASKVSEAWSYLHLGEVSKSLGEFKKAQTNHEKALALFKQMGDRMGEGSSHGRLGIMFHCMGEYAKAKEHQEKAILISKETKDIASEMTALADLAMTMLFEGNINEAKRSVLGSIHKFEKIRSFMKDADEQLKISLLNRHVQAYHLLCLLLYRTRNADKALYVVELGRARELAELMSAQYSLPSQISHDPHTWVGIETVMKNETNCTCLYICYVLEEMFLWIIKAGEPVCLRSIDANTCFDRKVSGTYVGDIFGSEILWQSHVLSQEQCEDRSWFHSLNSKSPSRTSCKENGLAASSLVDGNKAENQQPVPTLSECYNMIIAPVAELLDKAEIIVVPDRHLFKIPFAALQDQTGNYLSESFKIRIVPSLTTLKLIHDSPSDYHSQTGVLIVGDPDVGEVLYRGDVCKPPRLPFAEMEAGMIAQLLGAKSLIGKQAAKQAVLQSISSFSLVHFAAHGNAERGEIPLAPSPTSKMPPEEKDYLLTIHDISKVRLRAKLVVLSCCHSARGHIKAEGAVGIARAFLGSGARSVLVALWALEDKATKHFMSRFYEHLVHRESASESLHEAMKWMRANGFPDVGQWAPFMLIGDNVSFDFGN